MLNIRAVLLITRSSLIVLNALYQNITPREKLYLRIISWLGDQFRNIYLDPKV